MDDDTPKSEIDPALRESLEGAHYAAQIFRWDRAGRKLSERRRAELLAELELSILWDDLADHEREQAVADVAEDRDWPGLFDKLAAESAEAEREADAQELAAQQELAKTRAAVAEQLREMAEQRADVAEGEEAARRKEREAARKALLKEREKLTATRDTLVK